MDGCGRFELWQSGALRQYMIAMLKYWIQTCDVDGFRCDAAAMMPTDFWEQVRAELHQGQTGHYDARRGQQAGIAYERV
jgi:glycosidase